MKQLRIIVAEDETLVALSIISQLKEIGHIVVGDATDGVEVIELCGKLKPDMVLMDINMPRMDGIQAAKEIKNKYQIPVVIVSGYSDENLIEDAAEAGVFSYLVKPVTKKNLAPAIEVALQNHLEYSRVNEESNYFKKSLDERKLIERAKGILMKQKNLTEDEAMKKLQKLSNNKNQRMAEVAKEIISADKLFN
jgi:Response regulator with putative antiterminator output domain